MLESNILLLPLIIVVDPKQR